MKKFELLDKVNFVDENDVFVGYDMGKDCCEYLGYFISREKPNTIIDSVDIDLDNFVFDRGFFEDSILDRNIVDDGGSVLFRLIGKDDSEAYLCLYNCHNGYYAHGFEMKIDGHTVLSDSI
jgi:hypothetical protein